RPDKRYGERLQDEISHLVDECGLHIRRHHSRYELNRVMQQIFLIEDIPGEAREMKRNADADQNGTRNEKSTQVSAVRPPHAAFIEASPYRARAARTNNAAHGIRYCHQRNKRQNKCQHLAVLE